MTTSMRAEQRFAAGAPGKGDGRSPGGKAADPNDKGAAAGKASKRSFITSKKGLLALVALIGIGGGSYKTFMPAGPAGPPRGGAFVAMDATTLNLQDGHYLKLAVAIQLVKGKATPTSFETSKAAALVITEFSNRSVAELSTQAGRGRLTAELLGSLKSAYPGEVYQVYLTQFVTQ